MTSPFQDIEQFPNGLDYSELPLNQDRLAHLLARYAALLAANTLQSPWVRLVTKTDDFPIPAPRETKAPREDVKRISEVETIFNGLVKKWQEETAGSSVTTRRYAHPSYHAILLLKEDAVPLILRELQQRPDWWFEALKLLTKDNPVKPRSTFEEAVNAWIEWGKQNNRIP